MKILINMYVLLALAAFLTIPLSSSAYSVLTHEAIIDASWEKSIQPLLKLKYPGSTEEQLKEAHAYAYGGAIIDDMGYYPFGSIFFSNLVHYVRSGDFVSALLEEARDINEYAFALGVLSHYTSDIYGHPLGTNIAVPLTYPKDKEKYGNIVTYTEDRTSHLRMEFSFDVLQTVKGNYASLAYHNFIGFKVSQPVLERAFLKTYGMDINDVFGNLKLAIGTFRWSVKNLIPEATKYAWIIKKAEIKKIRPSANAHNFRYRMKKANYYEEFGKEHKKPPVTSWAFTIIMRFFPKIGPLKGLRFTEPGEASEKLFIQSFDAVMVYYNSYLKKMAYGKNHFANKDLDTGKLTASGEYNLCDENYGKLVLKLEDEDFEQISPALKHNIIAFYSDRNTSVSQNDKEEWGKLTKAIEELKSTTAK